MNFKAFAASALVAASSLLGVAPAEASTPWIFVGNDNQGQRYYVRTITQGEGPIRYFYNEDDTKMAFNCKTGYGWSQYPEELGGDWHTLGYYRPGSIGEGRYNVVCRGHRPAPY